MFLYLFYVSSADSAVLQDGAEIYFLLNQILLFQVLWYSILIMAKRCSQGSHLPTLKKLRLHSYNCSAVN